MKSSTLLIVPIAAFILLISSGCSVAGYMVGAAIEEGEEPTYEWFPTMKLLLVEEGTPLRLERKNAPPVEGRFARLSLPEETAILDSVEDRGGESTSGWNIHAGDRILLTDKGAKEREVLFLGATTRDIWYREPGEHAVQRCSYSGMERIRSGSVEYSRGFLQRMTDGELEAVYDVHLQGGEVIPLRDVRQLMLPKNAHGTRTALTMLGGAVDLTLLIVMLPSMGGADKTGNRSDLGIGKWLDEHGSSLRTGL
ncbi:hypothetical protein KQI65_16070 [bacterium]|nr:hypothetical protein [bacterium]